MTEPGSNEGGRTVIVWTKRWLQ